MTLITGTVTNLVGEDFSDFVLEAKATNGFFNSSTLVAQSIIHMRAISGAITGNIPSTDEPIIFTAHYTADGIYQDICFNPTLIPNVSTIDISDLLTVRTSS